MSSLIKPIASLPFFAAILICAALMTGCGKEKLPKHFSVTGQVLDSGGTPIEGVHVYFWATTEMEKHEGRFGGGTTDIEGRFSITSNADVPGIAAGEYKVTFTMTSSESGLAVKPSESEDAPSAPFSEEYGSFENTPETVQVFENENEFTFRLN